MSSSNIAPAKKQTFSVAITTENYRNLINNTLKEPGRANRFIASITSAVAITPALQTCDPGSILAGGLLGEALNLSPSPQLGQYYLVPFKQKAKYDREGHLLSPECSKAQFVLGYKGIYPACASQRPVSETGLHGDSARRIFGERSRNGRTAIQVH